MTVAQDSSTELKTRESQMCPFSGGFVERHILINLVLVLAAARSPLHRIPGPGSETPLIMCQRSPIQLVPVEAPLRHELVHIPSKPVIMMPLQEVNHLAH